MVSGLLLSAPAEGNRRDDGNQGKSIFLVRPACARVQSGDLRRLVRLIRGRLSDGVGRPFIKMNVFKRLQGFFSFSEVTELALL